MSGGHVMIMAGGTGGHIFPGLAVADVLRARGTEVSWLGTTAGLENRLVVQAGIEFDAISIQSLRGRGLAGWFAAPLRILRAAWQARSVLRRRRPQCVLSMGGYVAGPGALAARLMGIPLVIHEQNAVAGLTNRWLRPLARRVMTGFPESLPRGEHVGNPVRADIAAIEPPESRMASREGALRVLVIGGSQGAAAFTHIVPGALARVDSSKRPEIVHQAGRQYEETCQAYQALDTQGDVREFINDMAAEWTRADLAVCRSGALTVAELAAAGVASVLVPFPHAVDDHQTANAHFLSDAGAAWLVDQADFTADWLAALLEKITRDDLIGMARKARALARADADERVADACEEVMR